MVSHGKWIAGLTLGVLGGCFASYGYNDFDGKGTGGEGTGGGGGQPGSSSISASSSSSSGGAGGNGNCPSDVLCDNRPAECTQNCFVLNWAHRSGNSHVQYAHSAAIDSTGNVAIAGEYHDSAFTFSDGTPKYTPSDSEVPGSPFMEGFVAYFAAGGAVNWAQSLEKPSIASASSRIAYGVAFDSNDDLIVVGKTSDKMTGSTRMFLRKYYHGSAGNSTVAWTLSGLLSSSAISEGLAVTTHMQHVYVLGRSESTGTPITCGAKNVTLASGMFVAKFDGNKTCMWIKSINTSSMNSVAPIAITARDATTNGVWITGTFTSQIDTTPWPVLNATGISTFVVSLNENDGEIMSAIGILPMTGTITPAAIDTLGTGSAGKGTIFLAGTVVGKTQLSPNLMDKQSAAILTALDVEAPPAMGAMQAGTFTPRPILLNGPLPTQLGARGTGVALRNGKLHLSGTFATSIAIPPAVPEIAHSGNVPFLATFDTAGPTPLGFDSFLTGTDMEDFGSDQVFLAGSAGGLALAGGWTTQLDLSTRDRPIFGVLKELDTTTSVDVFVAKFVLPAP